MIRYFKMRKAIRRMMEENDQLFRDLAEAERGPITNLTWEDDDGLYRAWSYNEKANRYYFDDYGDESFMAVWDRIFQKDGEEQ